MKYPISKHAQIRSRSAGFTLVELLVTIVIIATLAVISFVMYGKVSASSQQAVCVNILRQYGTAMAGYLSDNHNRMPNFQVNLQKPNYHRNNDYHLYGAIHPYLGLETPSKLTALPDNLVCPAWRKRFPKWNSKGDGNGAGNCYHMNQDQVIGGRRVFGTQGNNNNPSEYGGMPYAKIADGTNKTPVSKIVFISDGHHPTERNNPVHGKMRNALFLDFHVESRLASEVPMGVSP